MCKVPGVESQRMTGNQPHEEKRGIPGERLAYAEGERQGMSGKNGKLKKLKIVQYD